MPGATSSTRPRLAVVGAGAAGTLFCIHAAETAARTGRAVELTLIDPNPATGRGDAYTTEDPRHRLNVPAGKMSCFPDDPDHFLHWLSRHGTAGTAASFATRHSYGSYLADTLASSVARNGHLVSFRRLHARATGCSWHGSNGRLELSDGSAAETDCVVLATGPLPGVSAWAPRGLRSSGRFTATPWSPGALDELRGQEGNILLVGTGLTAVDLAVTLGRSGRTVYALSRHGRLPRAHAVDPLPPAHPSGSLDGLPLSKLRGAVRRHVREVVATHGDWRPAVDGLRPLTSQLWRALGDEDRAEFLRGDRSLWDVCRHRMAPETAEAVARLRRSGRLRVLRGEVTDARAERDGVVVTLDASRSLAVHRVVDCTGPGANLLDSRDPLYTDLLARGLALPGPMGMGLATTSQGRLRTPDGPARPLWTLGSPRRGELWESTAVPEIRQQALEIAEAVLAPEGRTAGGRPGNGRTAGATIAATGPGAGRGLTGATVWLTGLPSAGKTTIARAAADRLRAEGRRVEVLDGDEVREFLSAGLGFSREDRHTNVQRIGFVAQLLAAHGVLVLVPVIAPYAGSRAAVAERHAAAGTDYLEVHVATPVEVCSVRDVKGLYAKQAAGEISGLTGVDDPYEPPAAPDLRIETHERDVSASVAALHGLLTERGLA